MVLVISDHFIRWKDAIAIPDGTTETITTTLEEKSLPKRILSDRGTQFESKPMYELCNLWGISKSKAIAYHPQGNGVGE